VVAAHCGRRGAHGARFDRLVGADALPAGNWQSRDEATRPITSNPWDKRAKAAGCVTIIRAFVDPTRRAVVQIRPLVSEDDAQRVLSTFPSLIDRADTRVVSSKEVTAPPVNGASAGWAHEALYVGRLVAMTLAVVSGRHVVSIRTRGARGAWSWAQLRDVLAAQLLLLNK